MACTRRTVHSCCFVRCPLQGGNASTLEVVARLSLAAGAFNHTVLFLCRPKEIIILLVATFWGIDSMLGSTLLLQHLHQIRHHTELARAVSAFVCQLVAEACSRGDEPIVSLQCLLVEVSAFLVDLATLLWICTVQHCTLLFGVLQHLPLYRTTVLHFRVLFCSVAQHRTCSVLQHTRISPDATYAVLRIPHGLQVSDHRAVCSAAECTVIMMATTCYLLRCVLLFWKNCQGLCMIKCASTYVSDTVLTSAKVPSRAVT